MSTFIVAISSTNTTVTAPPLVTIFLVDAPSDNAAEQAVRNEVVAPIWGIETVPMPTPVTLASGEVRKLP